MIYCTVLYCIYLGTEDQAFWTHHQSLQGVEMVQYWTSMAICTVGM